MSGKLSLFGTKVGADCKFLVGTRTIKEVTGHKVIFANASSVFRNMFFGSVADAGEIIIIPDIEPDVFRTMASFFYTGHIEIASVEHAILLWYSTDKYDVQKLKKIAIDYLTMNMTYQNVCFIYQYATFFTNIPLMKQCEKTILADIPWILSDSSISEGDLSAMNFIIDQNHLNVSEFALFRALALNEHVQKTEEDEFIAANKITLLKKFVKKIRFLTMTPVEFGKCMKMSSLVSPPEALSILLNISDPSGRHSMPEGFSTITEKRNNPELQNLLTYLLLIFGFICLYICIQFE